MRSPRYGSGIWKAQQRMYEAERIRPKSTTNWSTPYTNIFSGMNSLRSALASGQNAKLEKRWNKECDHPIKENPKDPYNDQIVKKFKHKVWVVVLYYNYPKIKTPFFIHILNVLLYPLKYIPKKSILRMTEYKIITFRVGSVVNGFTVDFHIPKKFSFK